MNEPSPYSLGHPPPAPRPWAAARSAPASRVGLAVFFAGEALFFVILVVAWFVYYDRPLDGPSADDLARVRAGLFSLALFASSGTVWLAGRGHRAGDLAAFRRWWVATIALGVVFLAGTFWEYADLAASGATPSTNLFTASYFVLTGFHTLHVAVGVLLLSVFGGMTWRAESVPERGVEGVGLYWHFVDAVWVVVFTSVYLIPALR